MHFVNMICVYIYRHVPSKRYIVSGLVWSKIEIDSSKCVLGIARVIRLSWGHYIRGQKICNPKLDRWISWQKTDSKGRSCLNCGPIDGINITPGLLQVHFDHILPDDALSCLGALGSWSQRNSPWYHPEAGGLVKDDPALRFGELPTSCFWGVAANEDPEEFVMS